MQPLTFRIGVTERLGAVSTKNQNHEVDDHFECVVHKARSISTASARIQYIIKNCFLSGALITFEPVLCSAGKRGMHDGWSCRIIRDNVSYRLQKVRRGPIDYPTTFDSEALRS